MQSERGAPRSRVRAQGLPGDGGSNPSRPTRRCSSVAERLCSRKGTQETGCSIPPDAIYASGRAAARAEEEESCLGLSATRGAIRL